MMCVQSIVYNTHTIDVHIQLFIVLCVCEGHDKTEFETIVKDQKHYVRLH